MGKSTAEILKDFKSGRVKINLAGVRRRVRIIKAIPYIRLEVGAFSRGKGTYASKKRFRKSRDGSYKLTKKGKKIGVRAGGHNVRVRVFVIQALLGKDEDKRSGVSGIKRQPPRTFTQVVYESAQWKEMQKDLRSELNVLIERYSSGAFGNQKPFGLLKMLMLSYKPRAERIAQSLSIWQGISPGISEDPEKHKSLIPLHETGQFRRSITAKIAKNQKKPKEQKEIKA